MMEPNQDKQKQDVLGSDPFADIEDLTWDDAPTEADDPFDFLEEALAEEAAMLTAVSEPPPEPEPEPTADFLEEKLAAAEIVPEELETAVDDPFDLLETEMAFDNDTLSDGDILPSTTGDETEPVRDEPEAPFTTDQSEDTADSHYLEDLIANIDGEIDALYGAGSMINLADTTEDAASIGEEQHIIFDLAGVEYTVPINNLTEIGRPLGITRVPNVPEWVLGVANLRGDVISMVDLRIFLELPVDEYGGNHRLLVAQSHTEDITIGLLVDRVVGIGNLITHKIGAPTAPIEDQVAPYLRGVYEYEGRLLVVLNLDKLLRSAEMQQFVIMN